MPEEVLGARVGNSPAEGVTETPLNPSNPARASEGASLPAPLPPSSTGQREAAVRVEARGNALRIETPRGWRDPADIARDLAPLRPELLRALAPGLPAVDAWPPSWRELFEERASIAAEGGASDAEAFDVAEADLRVAVWRGDVEAPREVFAWSA